VPKKAAYIVVCFVVLALSLIFLVCMRTQADPEKVLVEARGKTFSSKGWSFEEKVNFSSARLLISGNVDLENNALNTTIIKLQDSFPSLTITFSNKSSTYVNIEGGWIRVGSGWTPEQTVLYRALELAISSQDKSAKAMDRFLDVFFEGRCSLNCKELYETLQSLAALAQEQPVNYRGVVRIEDGFVKVLYIEFLSRNQTVCTLLYVLTEIRK
jgi:hypothetical protein